MADHHIPAAEIRRVWMDPNLTTAGAARQVGLARSGLWLRAMGLGLPPRKLGNRFAQVDEALFRQMWDAGVGSKEIAAHFGLQAVSIRALRCRFGLPPRPAGGFKRPVSRAEFFEAALGRAMAASARQEQAIQRQRNLVDVVRKRGNQ